MFDVSSWFVEPWWSIVEGNNFLLSRKPADSIVAFCEWMLDGRKKGIELSLFWFHESPFIALDTPPSKLCSTLDVKDDAEAERGWPSVEKTDWPVCDDPLPSIEKKEMGKLRLSGPSCWEELVEVSTVRLGPLWCFLGISLLLPWSSREKSLWQSTGQAKGRVSRWNFR